MRMLAKAAIMAAPMVISFGAIGAAPAFASGGSCSWGNTSGGANSYPAGTTIAAAGIVYSCSSGGTNSGGNNVWIPAGTTEADSTSGLVTWYDGTQNAANYTAGAGLQGDDGDAYVLGSGWADVGSWGDYFDSFTQCVGASCDDSGGPAGLQP